MSLLGLACILCSPLLGDVTPTVQIDDRPTLISQVNTDAPATELFPGTFAVQTPWHVDAQRHPSMPRASTNPPPVPVSNAYRPMENNFEEPEVAYKFDKEGNPAWEFSIHWVMSF